MLVPAPSKFFAKPSANTFRSSGSSDDSMNLNDIVRRLKEVQLCSSKVSSNYFISFTLQNQWSKNGNEPGSSGDQEKTKPDLKLEFQFEKVKKLEGELATEQQRLKVINLTT